MGYSYEYTTSNVKVRGVVIAVDKRNSKILADFELRGLDWNTSDSDYVQAIIRYGGANKATENIYPSDHWKSYRVEWTVIDQNLQDLGSQSIILRVQDEDDTTADATKTIDFDIDPNEYQLTLVNPPSFGDDSTPDIAWSLNDLASEQKMTPVITVGASTTNSMTVTFADATTVSGLSSGYINLNGVKYSESSLVMNSADAGKAYWKAADKYTITAPTMSSGDNSFSIALNCTTM